MMKLHCVQKVDLGPAGVPRITKANTILHLKTETLAYEAADLSSLKFVAQASLDAINIVIDY